MDKSDLPFLQLLTRHCWFSSDLNQCLLYTPATIDDAMNAMTFSFNTGGGKQQQQQQDDDDEGRCIDYP